MAVEDDDFLFEDEQEEEDESPAAAEDEQSPGNPDEAIHSLKQQLQNRDAIIQRLKGRLPKKIEQASVQAAEEAVELYKQTQARLSRTKNLFQQAGFPGLAQDFLALNDDSEPTPDAVKVYLASRGLSPSENRPVSTEPPAAANFHAGSGTSPDRGPMSHEQFRELYRTNPAAAAEEMKRRGMDSIPESWWFE